MGDFARGREEENTIYAVYIVSTPKYHYDQIRSALKRGKHVLCEPPVGYQSSTVLDELEREAGTTSIPIPQREESENIPSPDLPEQLENVQQSGNEIAERGMQT